MYKVKLGATVNLQNFENVKVEIEAEGKNVDALRKELEKELKKAVVLYKRKGRDIFGFDTAMEGM